MRQQNYIGGLRSGFMVAVSASPFGALFGAVALENGLTPVEAMVMSATIYAGASQLVGIELFGHHTAAWLIVLSVFAVNFRHILYSASLTRPLASWTPVQKLTGFFFLVDPQFAETIRRRENGETVKFSWYMGFASIIYVAWMITTLIGIWLGSRIGDPESLGLDVLLPVYFLGMVAGFRLRKNFYPVMITSAVAATLAHQTVGSPWHVSIGAMAGIAVAVFLARPDGDGQQVEENEHA